MRVGHFRARQALPLRSALVRMNGVEAFFGPQVLPVGVDRQEGTVWGLVFSVFRAAAAA